MKRALVALLGLVMGCGAPFTDAVEDFVLLDAGQGDTVPSSDATPADDDAGPDAGRDGDAGVLDAAGDASADDAAEADTAPPFALCCNGASESATCGTLWWCCSEPDCQGSSGESCASSGCPVGNACYWTPAGHDQPVQGTAGGCP
jgi:hypothetical protein